MDALQVGQLKSQELLIRQKALSAAHELLSSKYSHEQCVASGITLPLTALLQVSKSSCNQL